MSNKYKILELLKQNELTVKEIADTTEFNENEVRVYIHRLLKDNLIKEIGKKNRYYIYSVIEKEPNKVNKDLINYLKFYNDFFKDNIEYLMKNPKIVKFIEKNENIFNKIEMVTTNA